MGRKEDDMESDNVTVLLDIKAIALIKGGLKIYFLRNVTHKAVVR